MSRIGHAQNSNRFCECRYFRARPFAAGEQLTALGEMPSHVAMLNMLARAAGYRNFQQSEGGGRRGAACRWPVTVPPPLRRCLHWTQQRIDRVAGLQFGARRGGCCAGQEKTNHQELCVWVLWSRLPARGVTDERGISAWLNEHCMSSAMPRCCAGRW